MRPLPRTTSTLLSAGLIGQPLQVQILPARVFELDIYDHVTGHAGADCPHTPVDISCNRKTISFSVRGPPKPFERLRHRPQ